MFAFIKISGYLRTSKLKIVKEEYGIIRLRCCSIKNQQSTKWRIWKWFYSNHWKTRLLNDRKCPSGKSSNFFQPCACVMLILGIFHDFSSHSTICLWELFLFTLHFHSIFPLQSKLNVPNFL